MTDRQNIDRVREKGKLTEEWLLEALLIRMTDEQAESIWNEIQVDYMHATLDDIENVRCCSDWMLAFRLTGSLQQNMPVV